MIHGYEQYCVLRDVNFRNCQHHDNSFTVVLDGENNKSEENRNIFNYYFDIPFRSNLLLKQKNTYTL